ncbi:DUF421 domain-containing protein [Sediminibacillus terrae]|uniref:DUF421 domain-containing protein n=1 Tax=Sediminibacillus terrae TaxID=1562106 RepID=UPI0012970A24|nr:DUF421 domain-containing protein [Sediminibacillus terrae]
MFLSIIFKLLIGLIGIVAITRFLGKKELSQVTPLDFVYVLILGGIIEEAIYDQNTKFYHVLFALFLWGFLIWGVEKITQKFETLRTIMKGKNVVLIEDGKVNVKTIKENKLEIEEIRTLLRMKGIFSINQVQFAILETSGMISVIEQAKNEPVTKKELLEDYTENAPSYLLIEEKEIKEDNLKKMGKEKDWILSELKKKGYQLNDIYFAEWNKKEGLFIQVYQ